MALAHMLPERTFTESEREGWKEAIYDIYNRMRAKARAAYAIEYGGQAFTVLPEVYAPEFFDDTLWYATQLKDFVPDRSFLEIGTGTGVIAVFAAQAGAAAVVATDINPKAVKNARLNAESHGLQISVREGDMYDPIGDGERFDIIFWAHPFNAWELPYDDMLLRSGIDPQYKSLEAYIAGAADHLTQGGMLLLGTGDSADLSRVQELAGQYGYTLRLLRETERPLEKGTDKVIRDLIVEFVPRGRSPDSASLGI